ncbi:5-deoxy-glucuronate isomerase [Endozoicomonas sp. OPT23]|uniref:5-deoxy-glucuronate isomerase n=1 Tax=Endozoicomonas sp. OPT23 TaxID=2072845 RepID=UPI00129A0C54|nr:5-deoxy-glucuronate isomerase [Endozoicomonas sp. OPT23]MRI33638.1 5-deoxy-glucuronate isomerase [Endozoicomonas sp. OPT23]
MSFLLSRPTLPDQQGRIQSITPESADWKYVGFEVFQLKAGQSLEQLTVNNEVCLVLVSGKANVSTRNENWNQIGDRDSVFDQKAPYSVYIPPSDLFSIVAETDIELAVCKAPAEGRFPAKLILPEECEYQTRGTGTNQRHVCNILFNEGSAESLLVCEVITPNGHWSSYPPHKHDQDAEPVETLLEETYYHKVNPPQGFAFQRVYTDDRSLDETMAVENNNVVMVPRGYHPVGAAHGYDLYYLNVMAGPKRNWVFKNDPAHEWIVEANKK